MDGDVINLGKDKVYNFSASVELTKNVTLVGENVTLQGIGSEMPDGLIEVYEDGAGSTITGLTFNNLDDANKYLYNGNTKIKPVGIAIYIASTSDITVDNCVFYNWYNSAISLSSANFAVIQNSQFYGGTATFINNIPDGPKDRGTYHISAMSSRNTLVFNNSFYGTVCDGVSVAGNSLNSQIIGNYFEDNAFSIYFGGKSTEGTLIADNTFVDCGWFESDVYTTEGVPTGDHVKFTNLPVISVQKSADSFAISNNTFKARNGNVLIKALEGSTAHGGASSIGNITITDNTVLPIANDVVMSSVDFTYIETYNDVIKPIGEILIANNELNGARGATYWSLKWGDMWGDVSIKAADVGTIISIKDIAYGAVVGVLQDAEGNLLSGESISYATYPGLMQTVETDEYGEFIIEGVSGTLNMFFEGYGSYLSSNATVDVPLVPVFLTAPDVTAAYKDRSKLVVTVKDIYGNVVSGVKLKLVVNKVAKYITTDANGQVALSLNNLDIGTYTATITFLGNEVLAKASTTAKIHVVEKMDTTLTALDVVASYNDSGKLVATLTDANDDAISGAKIKIVLNKVTKYITTDANGQVALGLNNLNPGNYTAAITFVATELYNKSSTSAKVTIM